MIGQELLNPTLGHSQALEIAAKMRIGLQLQALAISGDQTNFQ